MMYQSVTGAKDAMIGAVMGGVEKTRAAVNESINSVSQMVSSGVNLALSHSESWVDHYLPLSEKELGEPTICISYCTNVDRHRCIH